MAGKGAPLTRRLELRVFQPQMLVCHLESGATRDHESPLPCRPALCADCDARRPQRLEGLRPSPCGFPASRPVGCRQGGGTRNRPAPHTNALPLHLPCLSPSKSRTVLGRSTPPLFHSSTFPPFPVPSHQDRSVLDEANEGLRRSQVFRVSRRRAFVSLRLAPLLGHPLRGRPTAGGYEGRRPKGRARGEGRNQAAPIEIMQ